LGRQLHGLFASFGLTDQGRGVRIKANGDATASKVVAKIVAMASYIKAPIGANTAEPPALGEIQRHLLQRQQLFLPLGPIESPRVNGLGIGLQRGLVRENPTGQVTIEHVTAFIQTRP